MGASWAPPGWFWTNDSRLIWRERFAWLPCRSSESNQRIWLKKHWYGYRWIDGPAGEDPIKSERWLTEEEYVWYQLTSE